MKMIKLSLRNVAVTACMFLVALVSAPVVSAHEIKHNHHQTKVLVKTVTSIKHVPVPHHGHSQHQLKPTHAHPGKLIVDAEMCVTGTSWLNARSGPSTEHKILAELGEGQKLHESTCKSSNYGKTFWCKATLGYDNVVFVSKKFLGPCAMTYRDRKW